MEISNKEGRQKLGTTPRAPIAQSRALMLWETKLNPWGRRPTKEGAFPKGESTVRAGDEAED